MSKFQKQFRKMPVPVQHRASQLLLEIDQGLSVREFNGKFIERVKAGKRLVSLNIGTHYRLLLELTKEGLEPQWIGHHSQYSNLLKQRSIG